MATERLPMRKLQEILRKKWELGLSNRDVARSVGVSNGSVDNALKRALAAGFTDWASVRCLSEDELEARLYQRPQFPAVPGPRRLDLRHGQHGGDPASRPTHRRARSPWSSL